jgi:hypothetical protein
VLFSGRTQAPSQQPTIVLPTVTAIPTPQPTALPSVVPQANPHEVTLSAITLYGDYDDATKIGPAQSGAVCTITGQSPDGLWAWLSCPAPTGTVWAKVEDLELTADQRSLLLDTRVISRIVPTVPAFSPSVPQGSGPSLAFCADRESIWGRTHQCASTQAAADALADSEMRRINEAAEALNKQR